MPRDAQLEYKAILANASIGIAFTRDRKFTLCNPKFAEMLGWKAEELIGQPGEVVYPRARATRRWARSRCRCSPPAASSTSNGRCGAGRLDLPRAHDRQGGQRDRTRRQGTVWIVEDITARRRQRRRGGALLREQGGDPRHRLGRHRVRARPAASCAATRRYEQMYGYAPGELDGKPTSVDLRTTGADHAEAAERPTPATWRAARRTRT